MKESWEALLEMKNTATSFPQDQMKSWKIRGDREHPGRTPREPRRMTCHEKGIRMSEVVLEGGLVHVKESGHL